MQNFKTFGFKAIQINGVVVFTCNISINRIDKSDLPNIQGLNIYQTDKPMGKNKIIKETTQFTYTTMNYLDHSRMQKELGIFLEQYAIKKIKAKYQWAHPEDIKPQYHYEHIHNDEDLCF